MDTDWQVLKYHDGFIYTGFLIQETITEEDDLMN